MPEVPQNFEPRKDVMGGTAFAALQVLFYTLFNILNGEAGTIDVVAATGALAVLLSLGFAFVAEKAKVYASAFGGALATVTAMAYLWATGGQVDFALLSGAFATLSFIAVQVAVLVRPPATRAG